MPVANRYYILENRTEGWIAGLQLAGLSIRDRSEPTRFIASLSGSHRFILNYLTEEVLGRQSQEIQLFLLQTSILNKLHGDLCNAVTGRKDSSVVLEKLFSANLFLNPLDDNNQWFRYHHLFADLLQSRLRQTASSSDILTFHRYAANWFEKNGYVSEAVNHALLAKDFDSIARLVEHNADLMITRGELATVIRWIEVLPEDVVHLHPLIFVAQAWALTLAGAIRQVEPLLQQAETLIRTGDETVENRELLGNIAVPSTHTLQC